MNETELRTYLALAAGDDAWNFLGFVGRHSWRLKFYIEYGYLEEDTTTPGQKLLAFQSSWPELREDFIQFLISHPELEFDHERHTN